MTSTNSPAEQDGTLGSMKPVKLTNGYWLALTLSLLTLVVGLALTFAWRMDPFGVLRDPKGRALLASEDERRAKYLLNERYVPANYDALLIGSSASMSWRADQLTGYRFYNESVEGANASELRKIVEPALARGHFKVALVVVHPLITSFHDLGDGLDQASIVEALGSISSLRLDYEMLHPQAELRFPDGRRIKDIHTQPKLTDVFARYTDAQDALALGDYEALVQELQRHQVRVIYVTYPLFAPFWKVNEDILAESSRQMEGLTPGVPIIDFNTPRYADFRADATNYVDKIHLSSEGSEKLTRMIDARMHQMLGGGSVHSELKQPGV